jgi:hypothetical protein
MTSRLHLEPETEDPLEQNLAGISNFRLGRKCERVKTRQLIVGFERWGKKFYRTGLRVRMLIGREQNQGILSEGDLSVQ